MAESNSASYVRIGFTVFIGALAIVGALVYLGGLRGGRDLAFAETYFEKSVSGLSIGSPVNFRGVKIGEVADIGFVGDAYAVTGDAQQLIRVKMSFPRERIGFAFGPGESSVVSRQRAIDRLGLRATVSASGITGLSRIEIDIQTNVAPKAISWKPDFVYIPPAPSLLDSFSDAATKVMNQINKMDVSSVWSNVNASVKALAKTAEGAQAVLEARRGDIDKVMGDLTETMSSVRELVDEVKANPSLLVRERVSDPLPETSRGQ